MSAASELNEILARIIVIDTLCQDLSSRDKMDLLATAYLLAASQVRAEAFMEPGGFQAEQANQLAALETMAAQIRADTPDVELERLQLENDIPGILRLLKHRRDTLRDALDHLRPPDEEAWPRSRPARAGAARARVKGHRHRP